ncbi:MAG TPA: TatD family hydrolase [Actinomycetales bacterium]|nr:TatD family hydrolase [Actinomycetales bacterium]
MTDLPNRPPLPDPLPLPVVDNHTHLDIGGRDSSDAVPLRDLLDAATSVNVPRSVQIGCDLPSARWTVEAVETHPELVGGVAIHPNEAPRLAREGALDSALAEIESLAGHARVRVIGETGLDWYRTDPTDHAAAAAQHESFRAHVEMAKRLNLALQIHDRDAHADVLDVLAEAGAPERTVLHCFSGDAEMAAECVRRGYYLSFAGTVTFSSADGLREALSVAGPERVLVETDAPFLTPTPHRGTTNAGYLVPHTVRAMATVLGVDLEGFCAQLTATTEAVYGAW